MSDTDGTNTADDLKNAVIEQLMAVIGAPDDEDVARRADAAVRALDERLRAPGAAV